MYLLILAPAVLIVAAAGLYFLIRALIRRGSDAVGIFALVLGVIGIIIPLLMLMGDSSRETQRAVLISGAVIFGCGSIAASLTKKKE